MFSPNKSSVTKTCPSQNFDDPIPIVGILSALVICFAVEVFIHSNHYRYQSKEYWFDTKCKRGYADRVSDKVKGKSQRMKEWWNANTLDYKKDTELRDKKRLKQN